MAKTRAVVLNVNGVEKLSTEINYEDLVWLYNDYNRKNGKYPRLKDGVASNNLPQSGIINHILAEKEMTYNDFMLGFGVNYRIRTVQELR